MVVAVVVVAIKKRKLYVQKELKEDVLSAINSVVRNVVDLLGELLRNSLQFATIVRELNLKFNKMSIEDFINTTYRHHWQEAFELGQQAFLEGKDKECDLPSKFRTPSRQILKPYRSAWEQGYDHKTGSK